MNKGFKTLLPLLVTFIVLTTLIFITGIFFNTGWLDHNVLMGANCIFFLMSLVAFRLQRKAMDNANPNVFIRSVMGGVMIKMFVCIGAVMAYVLLSGKTFNKPSLFISMLLYLVYLVVEVAIMMKLNKRKNV